MWNKISVFVKPLLILFGIVVIHMFFSLIPSNKEKEKYSDDYIEGYNQGYENGINDIMQQARYYLESIDVNNIDEDEEPLYYMEYFLETGYQDYIIDGFLDENRK